LTLTVEEAAQALGISRAFAYESVAKGEIPCISIGKRILIPRIALDKMLSGTSDAGPASPGTTACSDPCS
jgi:excisionase family DNA binding protein